MKLSKNSFICVLGLSFFLSMSACADEVMTEAEEVRSVEETKEFEAAVRDAELDIAAEKDDNHQKLKSLAVQGDVKAQSELGINYKIGYEAPLDLEEAFRWLKKASESGDAQAQYYLAGMYDRGDGVDEDLNKALEWYLMSANQGYADAQFSLAKDYLIGWSAAPEDAIKSFEWATRAALQDHIMAQNWLGMLYDKGLGTQKNKTMAKEWYGRACSNDIKNYCRDYERLESEGY